MKTAGVVIDSWKLDIFKKHLNKGGFFYTEHPGLTKGTILLKVETEFVSELQPFIEAAQLECKNSSKPKVN